MASATNCDVSVLTAIANTADASTCKNTCNFVVPVESTENTRLADWEAFCASDACQRVLKDLDGIHECSIDGASLHQTVVNRIKSDCAKITRALRAADGSHVHSSGMDMGSASADAEDSHEETSSSTASSEAEDSHDTASGAEDSPHTTSSTSASAEAGDEGSTASISAGSTAAASASKSIGSSTGSKATSSNSTSSTPAPSASSTSAATSISIASGSVFLAAAAAFL